MVIYLKSKNIYLRKALVLKILQTKLRTFITEDSSRDDLVAHVDDVPYGVIKQR